MNEVMESNNNEHVVEKKKNKRLPIILIIILLILVIGGGVYYCFFIKNNEKSDKKKLADGYLCKKDDCQIISNSNHNYILYDDGFVLYNKDFGSLDITLHFDDNEEIGKDEIINNNAEDDGMPRIIIDETENLYILGSIEIEAKTLIIDKKAKKVINEIDGLLCMTPLGGIDCNTGIQILNDLNNKPKYIAYSTTSLSKNNDNIYIIDYKTGDIVKKIADVHYLKEMTVDGKRMYYTNYYDDTSEKAFNPVKILNSDFKVVQEFKNLDYVFDGNKYYSVARNNGYGLEIFDNTGKLIRTVDKDIFVISTNDYYLTKEGNDYKLYNYDGEYLTTMYTSEKDVIFDGAVGTVFHYFAVENDKVSVLVENENREWYSYNIKTKEVQKDNDLNEE